jgi:hypothetical protein
MAVMRQCGQLVPPAYPGHTVRVLRTAQRPLFTYWVRVQGWIVLRAMHRIVHNFPECLGADTLSMGNYEGVSLQLVYTVVLLMAGLGRAECAQSICTGG